MGTTGETVGVMFANLPTLRELAQDMTSNFVNVYSLQGMLEEDSPVWDWRVVAWNPHSMSYADEDHEAMDETNYDAVVSDIGEVIRMFSTSGSWVGGEYRYGTSWTHEDEATCDGALIDGVLIANPDKVDMDDMRQLVKRLSDYPLLDEEAYSEREWEAWQDYAPVAWHDEIRYDNGGRPEWLIDAYDECEVGDVLNVVCQQMHYYYGFSGDYSPKMLDIADELVSGAIAYLASWGTVRA